MMEKVSAKTNLSLQPILLQQLARNAYLVDHWQPGNTKFSVLSIIFSKPFEMDGHMVGTLEQAYLLSPEEQM